MLAIRLNVLSTTACLLTTFLVAASWAVQDGTPGIPGDPGTDGGHAADGEDDVKLEPGIRDTAVLSARAENGQRQQNVTPPER